jgi:hypothetical protein
VSSILRIHQIPTFSEFDQFGHKSTVDEYARANLDAGVAPHEVLHFTEGGAKKNFTLNAK